MVLLVCVNAQGIVNKLLHGPMTALRCDGTDPEAVNQTLANMDALEQMFQLSQVCWLFIKPPGFSGLSRRILAAHFGPECLGSTG